jgi:hypothetical protein
LLAEKAWLVLLVSIWNKQAPAESTCPLKNNPIHPLTNQIAARSEIQRLKQEMTFLMYAGFPLQRGAALSALGLRNME